MTDAELARSIAEEAGALLLRIRDEGGTGKALGDRGDAEANAFIIAALRRERPADYILSEEAHDDRARCSQRRVWIVDPLDGTREYVEGTDDWAVHIGLAVDGVATTGAVAVPALDQVFTTDDPPPAFPLIERLRILVSRSRAPDMARCVGEALGAETMPMGSAGAKAMAVIEGRAEIYLHDGGQYEWDNCAPAAVAMAMGLHASRIDGAPLVYNCENPLLPDLLICRAELAATVLAAVRDARQGGESAD